jgi:hypothetical protein
MVIEMLQRKGQTYRHDLVLVSISSYRYEDTDDGMETAARSVHRKRVRPAATNVPRDWYTYVDRNGFENVVWKFVPQFENLKQLGRELGGNCTIQ